MTIASMPALRARSSLSWSVDPQSHVMRSEAPVAEPLSEMAELWRALERMHWRHA